MNRNVERGKRFERRTVQLLVEGLGLRFFRNVVNSTFRGHSDRGVFGDVGCSDPEFPYTIECKSYKSFSIEAVLAGNTSQFDSFWSQAVDQAKKHGKKPMLFVTNGGPHVYIAIPDDDVGHRGIVIITDNGLLIARPSVILSQIKKRYYNG